ncbi:outer membrane protein assembly factor BamE (lipoprotein component of BamABCDE complex) [Pseudomonas sp. JUb96]|nr:outer membrane protein assembly factor BamE (lipoprotein component of BamABCDE complex) [Pseudomonas sp. JUb96]
MGNPLIQDTFHTNRWDYLYSLQPGGGQRQQERMSIFFNESDQLVSLSGDFMPGVSRDQEILGGSGDTSVTPVQPGTTTAPAEQVKETPAKPGSLEEKIQREVDTIETIPVPTPAPLETSPQ